MREYQTSERIPSRPFAEWLNQRAAYWAARYPLPIPSERGIHYTGEKLKEVRERVGLADLLSEIGWAPLGAAGHRKLHRYRRELSCTKDERGKTVTVPTAMYARHVVEEALFNAGVPFEDLYPEIAAEEQVEIEPKRWCCGCRETVTPIGGQCPWCSKRLALPTGQKLLGSRRAA